jgi:hypothetical protein
VASATPLDCAKTPLGASEPALPSLFTLPKTGALLALTETLTIRSGIARATHPLRVGTGTYIGTAVKTGQPATLSKN